MFYLHGRQIIRDHAVHLASRMTTCGKCWWRGAYEVAETLAALPRPRAVAWMLRRHWWRPPPMVTRRGPAACVTSDNAYRSQRDALVAERTTTAALGTAGQPPHCRQSRGYRGRSLQPPSGSMTASRASAVPARKALRRLEHRDRARSICPSHRKPRPRRQIVSPLPPS